MAARLYATNRDYTACDECSRLARTFTGDHASYIPACDEHTNHAMYQADRRTPGTLARKDACLLTFDRLSEREAFKRYLTAVRVANHAKTLRDTKHHKGGSWRALEQRAFDAALAASELWAALLDRAGRGTVRRIEYAHHLIDTYGTKGV